MMNFTPIASTVGGALIGLSASAMLFLNGRITGIAGIFSGILHPKAGDVLWRLFFVAGLFAGGAIVVLLHPQSIGTSHCGLAAVALAGVLVGAGTQLAGGCTSGHGVCGISRLSKRSIIATMTFVATGATTVLLLRQGLGGGP